jgi:hypothetical protein
MLDLEYLAFEISCLHIFRRFALSRGLLLAQAIHRECKRERQRGSGIEYFD